MWFVDVNYAQITFDMVVDDEVSIPAHGRTDYLEPLNDTIMKSQSSQFDKSYDDVFYSAASESYPHSQSIDSIEKADEPVTMTKIEPSLDDSRISKESMPILDFEGKPEERRNSITDEQTIQKIDPLGLIAFDSPSRFCGIRPALSCANIPAGVSLLDVDIMASPKSIAKYSQRDFDQLKTEFERRAEKQSEFMQFEIQAIQEKYNASLQTNNELRILLKEYEATMTQILDARKSNGDQLATIEQLLQDKRKLKVDLQTAQVAYQNLHARYEEVKALNEQLRVVQ